MKIYYKTPEEAEKALQREYYRSSLTRPGKIGGHDAGPDYRGDGRGYVIKVPEDQRKESLSR